MGFETEQRQTPKKGSGRNLVSWREEMKKFFLEDNFSEFMTTFKKSIFCLSPRPKRQKRKKRAASRREKQHCAVSLRKLFWLIPLWAAAAAHKKKREIEKVFEQKIFHFPLSSFNSHQQRVLFSAQHKKKVGCSWADRWMDGWRDDKQKKWKTNIKTVFVRIPRKIPLRNRNAMLLKAIKRAMTEASETCNQLWCAFLRLAIFLFCFVSKF